MAGSKDVSVKAVELRGKTKQDLEKKLQELKKDLYQLRMSKVGGGQSTNLMNIRKLRKGISTVLFVLNEKQREETKKAFENSALKPIDIRGRKHCRAYRRRLLPYQQKAVIPRVAKQNYKFPQRKFAVLA